MEKIAEEIKELEQQLRDCILQECEVYSRCVGYFRPIKQWNDGKKEDWAMRKFFIISDDKSDM
jgi:ribonucleoside-triphosphate reductase